MPRAGLVLLGFALGGFFDGILLHQVLQWHHLLSAVRNGTIPLATQIAADGLFHALMYVLALLAYWMLWRRRGGLAAADHARVLALVLAGFVLWHLVDTVVFHWIVGIHRVRMDATLPLAWDLGWLALFGGVPAAVAWTLWRRGPGPGGPGAARTTAAVVLLAVVAASWAARSPAQVGEDVLVILAPGTRAAQALGAVGNEGGLVRWVDADGGVWAVRGLRPGSAWRLLAAGAVVAGAAPVGLGCAGWSRVAAATAR